MHIYTRIGVFRLLDTTFGTTAWYELSPKFERKYQIDTCDCEGADSTAKEQESARSKLVLELVPELVPSRIRYISMLDAAFCDYGMMGQEFLL